MNSIHVIGERYPDLSRLPDGDTRPITEYMGYDPAVFAIDKFAQTQGNPREATHPKATADIMHDFAGRRVPYDVYRATLLHDIPNRMGRDRLLEPNTKRAVGTVFNDPHTSEESKLFIACRLADQVKIQSFTTKQREKFAAKVSETGDLEFARALTEPKYDKELPRDFWDRSFGQCDFEAISDLFDDINVTSGLIAAAEILQNISQPPQREAKVLQYIFDIQTFYAPFLEALGFNGFAMALRDKAAGVRYGMRQDEKSLLYLEQAKLHIAPLDSMAALEGVAASIFGIDKFEIASVVGRRSPAHSILIGDWVALLNGAAYAGALRGKTLLSGADKTARHNGEPIRDAAGLTAISAGMDEAIAFFAGVSNLIRNGAERGLELNPSPREGHSEVKGDSDYLELYMAGLRTHGVDRRGIDFNTLKTGENFRNAKVMARVPSPNSSIGYVSVEIQSTTKSDREVDNRGKAAHAFRKTGNTGTDAEVTSIRNLYERGRAINPKANTSNSRSVAAGRALIKRVGANRFEI